MKQNKHILSIRYDEKIVKGAMVRQYSLHYFTQFSNWFDKKSGARFFID